MSSDFPRRFGPYVLLRPLGLGGMGHITLAMFGEQGRERMCVIKRVLPQLRADPSYLRRFHDEAELVRQLSHGNLVETYAVGQADGEPFIAQAYVDGHDLSEIRSHLFERQEMLPIALAVFIAREVARGLEHAHNFGDLNLIHRDISPPNIRLTYSGEVKVLDFGLATSRMKTQLTAPGVNWGRAAYMAPEQIRDGAIDRSTDTYSLGVVLWEMLTAQPFGTTLVDGAVVVPRVNREAVLARFTGSDVPRPSLLRPEISEGLESVVLRACGPLPSERFQTAGELRTALGAFLPTDLDAEAALTALLKRLFRPDLEQKDLEELVVEARPLLPARGGVSAAIEPEIVIGDRYLLAEKIEGAGTARLHLARDRKTHEPVLLHLVGVPYNDPLSITIRQICATAGTDAPVPELLSIQDFGRDDEGDLFTVMPFFNGTDLSVARRQKSLPPSWGLHVAIAASRALEALESALEHGSSVGEPGSILIGKESWWLHDPPVLRLVPSAVLTPPNGNSRVRSPVEAVGRLLYVTLAGLPLPENPPAKLLENDEIPASAMAIVRGALAGDYADLAALRDALLGAVDAEESTSRGVPEVRSLPSSPSSAPKTILIDRRLEPRRNPLTIIVIAVGLLLAGGIGVATLFRQESSAQAPRVENAATTIDTNARPPTPVPSQEPAPPPLDVPPSTVVAPPPEATPPPNRSAASPETATPTRPPQVAKTAPVGHSTAPRRRPILASDPPRSTEEAPTVNPSPVLRPPALSPDELIAQARAAFARDELDAALRAAEKAAAANGGSRAQVVIGNVHFRRGHYTDAEKAYHRAVDMDPQDRRAVEMLAAVRRILGATTLEPPAGGE